MKRSSVQQRTVQQRTVKLCATLTLAVLLAPPAAGDWLVLRDGTRIETEGPWETQGRQVVFKRASGPLSTLLLADVDLEASAAATAASRQPAPPPATPQQRRSVLVLTDEDIRSAAAAALEESADEDTEAEGVEADDGAAEDAEAEAAAPEETVALVSWESRESNDIDGLEIIGSVRNTGSDLAAGIRVGVQVRDENEELLSDSQAFLQATSLAPGQRTSFKALLPGIYTLLVDPAFEVSSETISIQGPRRNEDAAEDGDLDAFDLAEPEG